jgi:hypothetical protein
MNIRRTVLVLMPLIITILILRFVYNLKVGEIFEIMAIGTYCGVILVEMLEHVLSYIKNNLRW